MDSRIKGLINVLEQTKRQELCHSVACAEISCCDCPFEDTKSKANLVTILKTYQLLEE